VDLGDQLGIGLATRRPGHQGTHLVAAQAGQGDRCRLGHQLEQQRGQGVLARLHLDVAVGADQEQPLEPGVLGGELQQPQRRRVGPVQVVEHQRAPPPGLVGGLSGQGGLADPSLPGDQHQPAVAVGRPGDLGPEHPGRVVPPDDRLATVGAHATQCSGSSWICQPSPVPSPGPAPALRGVGAGDLGRLAGAAFPVAAGQQRAAVGGRHRAGAEHAPGRVGVGLPWLVHDQSRVILVAHLQITFAAAAR
jgi:hypothetical protein